MRRMQSLVGSVLADRYRVVSTLGRGGFGWVYRATHVEIGTRVAIKVLNAPGPDEDGVHQARFLREAQATRSLKHPNTIKVFDFGRTPQGNPYLVMELIDGRSVADLLKDGPLDWVRACHIARQVLKSLAEAHEHGIIHRDLKADNVMVSQIHGEQDHVTVLDFGIAKMVGQRGSTLTATGMILGTPRYMAPELAEQGPPHPGSDLYALGVMMFEMVAGKPPFDGATPMGTVLEHLRQPVPELRAPGGTVSAQYAALVYDLLQKSPADRPASALAVLQRIDALLHGRARVATEQTIALRDLQNAIHPGSQWRRGRTVALLSALALALTAGAAAWTAAQDDSRTAASAPASARAPAPESAVRAAGGPAPALEPTTTAPAGGADAPPSAAEPSASALADAPPPAQLPRRGPAAEVASRPLALAMHALPDPSPAPPAFPIVLSAGAVTAEVLADGQVIGTTPLPLMLRATDAERRLTLRAAGHYSSEVRVDPPALAAADQRKLHVALRPLRARSTRPPRARPAPDPPPPRRSATPDPIEALIGSGRL